MEETSLSLLARLRRPGNVEAWQRLDDLYRPFIRRQLLHEQALEQDVDDLSQDILCVVVRELPAFQRRRKGSFRSWLRMITTNRLREYYRKRGATPCLFDPNDVTSPLLQLEDDASELTRRWDLEHDQHVVACLIEIMKKEFSDIHLKAFNRYVFDKVDAATVARELNITEAIVYNAKSRILSRLREEAEGLLG